MASPGTDEIRQLRLSLRRLVKCRTPSDRRSALVRSLGRIRRQSRRTVKNSKKATREASRALSRWGEQARRLHHVSLVRQFSQMLVIQLRFGFKAKHYYSLRLFEPTNWRLAECFFTDSELDVFYSECYLRIVSEESQNVLNNKARFRAHCVQHNLTSIPTIAMVEEGKIQWATDYSSLPRHDIFVKPIALQQGRGSACWSVNGTTYVSGNGERMDEETVLRCIHRLAAEERSAYLVQPALSNHPNLVGIPKRPLACIRAITVMRESNPSLGAAMLTIGDRYSNVANFTEGNKSIGAGIDIRSGEIGAAYSKDNPLQVTLTEMQRVPDWEEVRALVERAHATIPDVPAIGWDVAIAEDGPVLLEGNLKSGLESIQMAHQKPLAELGLVSPMITVAERVLSKARITASERSKRG